MSHFGPENRVVEHFHCDCNNPGCQISVDWEDETPTAPYRTLTVWLSQSRGSALRWRVKNAWAVLRGAEHSFGEVLLVNAEAVRFIAHVASLALNKNTAGQGATIINDRETT